MEKPLLTTCSVVMLFCISFLSCKKKEETKPTPTTSVTHPVTPTEPYVYSILHSGELYSGSKQMFSASKEMAEIFWDFGDGTSFKTAGGTVVSHTYPTTGTYTVVSLAENDSSKRVQILLTIQSRNTYSITGRHTVGDTMWFQPISPSDPSSSYLWTFGDGTTSTEYRPYHIYGKAMGYGVKLSVNGNDDLTSWRYLGIYDTVHIATRLTTARVGRGSYKKVNPGGTYLLGGGFNLYSLDEKTVKSGNHVFVLSSGDVNSNEYYFSEVNNPVLPSYVYYNVLKDSASMLISDQGYLPDKGKTPITTHYYYFSPSR
jgi:hypothetical protein